LSSVSESSADQGKSPRVCPNCQPNDSLATIPNRIRCERIEWGVSISFENLASKLSSKSIVLLSSLWRRNYRFPLQKLTQGRCSLYPIGTGVTWLKKFDFFSILRSSDTLNEGLGGLFLPLMAMGQGSGEQTPIPWDDSDVSKAQKAQRGRDQRSRGATQQGNPSYFPLYIYPLYIAIYSLFCEPDDQMTRCVP
jgi:hypothetical protein